MRTPEDSSAAGEDLDRAHAECFDHRVHVADLDDPTRFVTKLLEIVYG